MIVPSLLSFKGVHAFYGAAPALFDVSFEVPEYAAVAMLGANGAGKTTTFRVIYKQLRWTGRVNFAGQDVANWAETGPARHRIAHVPDGRGTFSNLSVLENLKLGAYPRRDVADIAVDIEAMFALFPRLRERYRQDAGMLSGGEQQMLAIARALMLRPRLMLLDELSFGVAPKIVAEILDRLFALKQGRSMTFLLAEQSPAIARDFADRIVVFETGRTVFDGTPRELADDEFLRGTYLGASL